MKKQLVVMGALLGMAACAQDAPVIEQDAPARRAPGGKGDVVVTRAQCDAFIADYANPCAEVDVYTATLDELEASIACQEEFLETNITLECCALDELSSSAFCAEMVETGRDMFCEEEVNRMQDCSIDSYSFRGACHQNFIKWSTGNDLDCCSRVDTWMCERVPDVVTFADATELADALREVDGYFWLAPWFSQVYSVDILPENAQNSIVFRNNPSASDMLAKDPDASQALATHTIASRIPVNYGIMGYGSRTLEISEADAYITLWRTEEGAIAIATHVFDLNRATDPNYGWATSHMGILEESACEILPERAKRAPSFAELSFMLDEVAGRVEESCVSELFEPLDPSDPKVARIGIEVLFHARYAISAESRLDTIDEVWAIETEGFSGFMLHASETLSDELREILGDDAPVHRTRILVNARGEVVATYDDEPCEQSVTAVDEPLCFGETF